MTQEEQNELNVMSNINKIVAQITTIHGKKASRLISEELFYLLVSYVTKAVADNWHDNTSYPSRLEAIAKTSYVIEFIEFLLQESGSNNLTELIKNPKTLPYLRVFDMTDYADTVI